MGLLCVQQIKAITSNNHVSCVPECDSVVIPVLKSLVTVFATFSAFCLRTSDIGVVAHSLSQAVNEKVTQLQSGISWCWILPGLFTPLFFVDFWGANARCFPGNSEAMDVIATRELLSCLLRQVAISWGCHWFFETNTWKTIEFWEKGNLYFRRWSHLADILRSVENVKRSQGCVSNLRRGIRNSLVTWEKSTLPV